MRILLDTNILVRLSNPHDPAHHLARTASLKLNARGDALFLVPQCLYEFWVVGTRPADAKANGLGLNPAEAAAEIQKFQALFRLINDDAPLFPTWLSLVTQHQVVGKNAHDARLAAAKLNHQLDALLTFNTPDFKRFGVDILHPKDVP